MLKAVAAAAARIALRSLYSFLRFIASATLAACSSVPTTNDGSRRACKRARIGFARDVIDKAPIAHIFRAATKSAFEIVVASSIENGSFSSEEDDDDDEEEEEEEDSVDDDVEVAIDVIVADDVNVNDDVKKVGM